MQRRPSVCSRRGAACSGARGHRRVPVLDRGEAEYHGRTRRDRPGLSFAGAAPALGGINISSNGYVLPRGYCMLFLEANQGTPSEAAWVRIQ